MNDSSPIADPASYPGVAVPYSCLLTHDGVWPMRVHPSGWTVDFEDGPVGVDEALDRFSAAPVEERMPVLAVGSNASAAQLRRKWAERAALAIPLTYVETEHLGVGLSAHVSKAGYVPYAPVRVEGLRARYVVSWLTAGEVADLDRTEPNYHPTLLNGKQFPAMLEDGTALESFAVYRGRWGVIADRHGQPLPAGKQAEAMQALAGFRTVTHAELGGDADLRAASTAYLAGFAVADGFDDEPGSG